MIDVKELLKEPLNMLLGSLIREVKQYAYNRILEYQQQELYDCMHTKTIIHRIKPVNLLDIYAPLCIDSWDRSFDYLGREQKENTEIEFRDFKDVIKFLNQNQYVILNGIAGSGKSTLSKYFVIAAVAEQYKIPIKVDLRNLNSFDFTSANIILEFFQKKLFEFHKLSVDFDITKELLESGKFLLLFDGFDELKPEIIPKVTSALEDFIKRFSDNNFLLTSRPHTNASSLNKFTNFWLKNLSPESVELFIQRQKLEKNFETSLLNTIQKNTDSDYGQFLKNPLLLNMFILTYHSHPNVPTKKSIYYSNVFDALFSIHDTFNKLGYERENFSKLSKEQLIEVLSAFSFLSYFENQYQFSENYINEKLQYVKDSSEEIEFDTHELLKDLLISICILVKDGNRINFIHRSMQEYFGVLYIKKLNTKTKNQLYSKIIDNFTSNSFILSNEFYTFFSLLKEIDYVDTAKLFHIPLLEKLKVLLSKGIDATKFDNLFLNKISSLRVFLEIDSSVSISKIPLNNGLFRVGINIESVWVDLETYLSQIYNSKIEQLKEQSSKHLNIINSVIKH